MPDYADLSPYRYQPTRERVRPLNVGWLDRRRPFARGPLTEEDCDRLWARTKLRLVRLRGLHGCNLCERAEARDPFESNRVTDKAETLLLGDAELRVFGPDGTVYAAPNLLIHVVLTHGDKPPEPFLRALREAPDPSSAEHRERLARQRVRGFDLSL